MSQPTADHVARVLDRFYAEVRRDPELGPVFNGIIGEDWPAHMQTINRFCSFRQD